LIIAEREWMRRALGYLEMALVKASGRTGMQRAEDRQALPPTAWKAVAIGATAIGAAAIGALAIGFLAIGRLRIGRLVVKSGEFGHLDVDELNVGRLKVKHLVIERDDRDS
jgi:hypothetical protein